MIKRTDSFNQYQDANPQNQKKQPENIYENSLEAIQMDKVNNANHKLKNKRQDVQSNQFLTNIQEGILKTRQNGKVQKIPQSIKQSLRKNATGRKVEDNMKVSKIALAILQKVRKMKKQFVCELCICEYDEELKVEFSQCKHQFCSSCLLQYMEYKVSRFQQIQCPQQMCSQIISLQSDIYNMLPSKVREKHKKIRVFYLAEKSNSRLCPDEKCVQGVIIFTQNGPQCKVCKKNFCQKCFFPSHNGQCQKNQVEFFQNNFKFRQCTACKSIIEKNQGCNHITCKCKYQFCYLCGGPWNRGNHRCPQNQQERRRIIEEQERAQRQRQAIRLYRMTWEYKCSCFWKIFLKVFILTPVFLGLVIINILFFLLGVILSLLCITIIGFFGYTGELICNQRNICWKIFEIILFPLVGIGAIFYAIYQLFPRSLQTISRIILIRHIKEAFYDW